MICIQGFYFVPRHGAVVRKFQVEINVGQVDIDMLIAVPVPMLSFTGSQAYRPGV
jgi:hypothetical protein